MEANNELELLSEQLKHILKQGVAQLSNIKPSEWVEQNVVMREPYPGKFSYLQTPYCREIIDCFAADHPMLWIAIMKGAQIGLSSGVIIPFLLYIIKNSPANTYFLVGSPDLVEKATEKLDIGIDNAGLRHMIKPQALRNKSQKTGDTNNKKEFPLGYIYIDSANNHKNIRDVSLKYGLFDDFESVKGKSKESGSTRKMLEQRFAAYSGRHKIAYISTPEMLPSNIEDAYVLGDQRKYMIPCPHCKVPIEWVWQVENNGITGGIVWKLDGNNNVIPESVGYICQECGEFFSDRDKHNLLNSGQWVPTKTPSKPGYYSYHISALYAPLWMKGWAEYIYDYLEANPPGQPRREDLHQAFVNLCLGMTYEPQGESPKATSISKNAGRYDIGIVPNKQSIADGNGRIVLLTCGCDLNGVVADARIDYEIVAHSESGATYSVLHGSVGTFIPRENSITNKKDRVIWTYEFGQPNSVWPEFDRIVRQKFKDEDGLTYLVNKPGIDFGHLSEYVYAFIDWSVGKYPSNPYVGVRGHKEEKYILHDGNLRIYEQGKRRTDTYFIQVGLVKDTIAESMALRWEQGQNQPPNYMNFPTPDLHKRLYVYETFFEHFESETRKLVEDAKGQKTFRWEKKTPASQNHLWDCRVYNMALKHIIMKELAQSYKLKEFEWPDYANFVLHGLMPDNK